MNTPVEVLRAIAHECDCRLDEIENKLETINDNAGLMPRPMVHRLVPEQRLDIIRKWLGTPEAHGVVEQTRDYVHRMTTP
jgi:hypothetical protein